MQARAIKICYLFTVYAFTNTFILKPHKRVEMLDMLITYSEPILKFSALFALQIIKRYSFITCSEHLIMHTSPFE